MNVKKMRCKALNLVICLMGLLMNSCIGFYTEMSHLSEEELEWVNCLNVGDTLFFESNFSHADTFVVSRKQIENTRNPFFIHFFDDYMGDLYDASASYTCEELNGDENFYLCMEKLVKIDSIYWYASMEERYLTRRYDVSHGTIYDRYDSVPPVRIVNILLNADTVRNCIIIDDSNSRLWRRDKEAENNIESFIISKDYGPIYYRYSNGEVFLRKFQ